uniref:Uncharacterized protein n=1 Tax=Rhipicephalus appendiculatus TaxID=34631 RepID=A0A131YEF5_RHIAP
MWNVISCLRCCTRIFFYEWIDCIVPCFSVAFARFICHMYQMTSVKANVPWNVLRENATLLRLKTGCLGNHIQSFVHALVLATTLLQCLCEIVSALLVTPHCVTVNFPPVLLAKSNVFSGVKFVSTRSVFIPPFCNVLKELGNELNLFHVK